MLIGLAVVAAVVLITAGALAAPRLKVPLPLLLLVIGVLVGLVPGVRIELDPELVLGGVLPPLLYAAAVQASLVDLKRTIWSVLGLAAIPVVVTTLAVGFALHAVLPSVSLAIAFALGAAVAPPDAVAATALGRSVGMPRRLIGLLEDESLLNDPVALTALTVAITAASHVITPVEVVSDLVRAVVFGVASGVLVGLAARWVRRRLQDPVLSVVTSFAIPYAAFLPAQALEGSGVLGAVIAGLIVAQATPRTTSPRARIAEAVNWRSAGFVLENAVFLLIGLQLPRLIGNVREFGLGTVLGVCAVVLVVVVAARFLVVLAAWAVVPPLRHRVDLRGIAVLGWAGMRGVVTLAAVFVLPDVRELPLLQLAAFVVVGGTLLLQGLTLGPLVRALRLPVADPAQDALQAAELMDRATGAATRRLDGLLTGDEPADVVSALRTRNAAQSSRLWELLGDQGGETPTALYRRLRLAMLQAQRDVVLAARDEGTTDDPVLRSALKRIDQEEAALDVPEEIGEGGRREELVDPRGGKGSCEHLRSAPLAITPSTPGKCEDCVREGSTWVHLRTCLTCGHVGCCDSSERRHADLHFRGTAHPVMRSAEPGEAWRWCYVDERLG
ncbi:cation:proton antiporter [Amnibacterium endophyticum]|uniref:Cation:proton antiporter n=1 Tax=Amnibacterium endophyticum TaxID=2109337 RepID=A0ABW4LIS5_9MICO